MGQILTQWGQLIYENVLMHIGGLVEEMRIYDSQNKAKFKNLFPLLCAYIFKKYSYQFLSQWALWYV